MNDSIRTQEFSNVEEVQEGITLRELYFMIVYNWYYIVGAVILAVTLGVVYTWVIANPQYEATTSVIVQIDTSGGTTTDYNAVLTLQRLIKTYQEFIKSDRVLDSVIEELDLDMTPSQIKENLSIISVTDSLVLQIKYTDDTPIDSAIIVNMIAEKLIDAVDGGNYPQLKDKLAILDIAKVPLSPSSPNKPLNVVISVLIGGVLGVGFVFIKEMLDNTFKSKKELESVLKLPVIGSIPDIGFDEE
jgi:capsular polysaccharide biosynthesis protein